MLFYKAKHRSDQKTITLYGNVDVRQVDLSFRVNGRVIGMPFEEGDFVPKGTLTAWLEEEPYLDQVKEAEANLQAAYFTLLNAEEIFNRRDALIESGSISQEDYDNAKTARDVAFENVKSMQAALGVAKKNLADTKVYAPSDGTILTRIKEPGSVVLESDPVYTLSLISPIWVRAFVPEPLLGEIDFGMEAKIYTDTSDDKAYIGHIGFISPVAEFTPKTVESTNLRTDLVYRIRIYADNPDWRLKQGMPVTVRIDRGSKQNHRN